MAMARVTENCTSCGIRLNSKSTTAFLCPGCGETPVGRCSQCRDQGVVYACDCGFAGP